MALLYLHILPCNLNTAAVDINIDELSLFIVLTNQHFVVGFLQMIFHKPQVATIFYKQHFSFCCRMACASGSKCLCAQYYHTKLNWCISKVTICETGSFISPARGREQCCSTDYCFGDMSIQLFTAEYVQVGVGLLVEKIESSYCPGSLDSWCQKELQQPGCYVAFECVLTVISETFL